MKPEFEKMSFERAVQLFEEWGFLVERGPRHGEVTLILEGLTHRSYHVCEPEQLAEMAAAILQQRILTGAVMTPALDIQ
ncbi:MAG: hypothetical protein ACE144_08885 [Thermodesulfobacteriota bacterium]